MAEALHSWIAPYLITVAEEYGADMHSVTRYNKNKKVQLTEWLTYANNDENSLLWATISDKHHFIPICFSNEAITTYNKLNHHKRITQHKTALIFIKHFKPIFRRVPRGGNLKLSSQRVLALDCDSVSLFGSYDEATFGSPREVETDSDLRLWSEGLRQDGGGGNVLKQRKEAKQVPAVPDPIPKSILAAPSESISVPKEAKGPSNVKTLVSIPNRQQKTIHRTGDLLRKRERLFPVSKKQQSWQISPQGSASIQAMPIDGDSGSFLQQEHQDTNELPGDSYNKLEEETYADSPCTRRRISSPQCSQKIQSRESSPGIPVTNWSPSPPPTRRKSHSSPFVTDQATPLTQTPSVPSSHPVAPTPAQRQTVAFPPSSPTSESQIVVHETVLLPPLASHQRYPVIRKVPRPPQPIPPSQSDSALTQILVPNSDTSLSYTQSQPQSQSQPHSQGEMPESSQPVVLSQLPALSKPRKDLNPDDSFLEEAMDADHGRKEDDVDRSLFSGSLDRNAQEAARSTKVIDLNGSPLGNKEEGLTDASIIAQAAVMQYQDSIDGAPDIVESQTRLSTTRDNMTIDVAEELDEDDAQIDRELFGPSYVSQSQDGILGPANIDYLSPKSPTAASTEKVQTTTLNGTPGMGVGVVQHDANAWSAPSFLRPSSTANAITNLNASRSSTDTRPHALRKSGAHRRLKGSPSLEASFSRSRAPHVDQNKDPAAPRLPQQPKKLAQAQKTTPGLTLSQSRPNKRSKDVSLDMDSISRPYAKKRRVEVMNDGKTTQKMHTRPSVPIVTEDKGRLNSGNLDRIVLAEEPVPLMSWLVLKDILLKTGRDRDKAIRL